MRAETYPQVIPLKLDCRTDPDVAEDLYVPEEKTNAVLRAEIDQLKETIASIRLEIKELNTKIEVQSKETHSKIDSNHRKHNDNHNRMERKMVVLVGDGDLGEGLVRKHEAAFKRVWDTFKELKDRVEDQKEATWKLKFALATGGFGIGGGFVYGLMRILGA